MPANPVLWSLDQRGVATVTLNRPEVNNAYDAGLIDGVLSAMDELGRKPAARAGYFLHMSASTFASDGDYTVDTTRLNW